MGKLKLESNILYTVSDKYWRRFGRLCLQIHKRHHTESFSLKAQLDGTWVGAWLGSFYVITGVNDKESYSNAPCIRRGAGRGGL
jgi:hypothetical protein